MTQRERVAPEAASEPVSTLPASALPVRLDPPTRTAAGKTLTWDEIYAGATPAQQSELLALAQRQGILYHHQLPPAGNGTSGDPARRKFSHWIAGETADLEPFRLDTVAWTDAALDDGQREAVLRALTTPDVCLIQGLPGSGKSRVAAELVTQATQRGQRVLLLGLHAVAVDRVLEQVAGRPSVCAIRCLCRGERPEDLPPALRGLTFAERLATLAEQALQGARRDAADAEQRCRRLQQDEPRLERFLQLVDQGQQLDAGLKATEEARGRVPVEVERLAASIETEPGANGDELRSALAANLGIRQRARQRVGAARADLDQRLAQRRHELSELEPEAAQIGPLVEAKRHGQWWTLSWWQATLQGGNVVTRMSDLETRRQTIASALAELEDEERRLDDDQDQAEQAYQGERARLCQAAAARRDEEHSQSAAGLRREQEVLHEKWQLLARELDPLTPPPAARTREAVQASRDGCRQQVRQQEQRAAFAREWAAALEQNRSALAQRLIAHANLVAATLADLAHDPHFGDAGRPFDLLVLEEAHLLTETELLQAVRRARRWVLIGQPAWDLDSLSAAAKDQSFHKNNGPTVGRPTAVPPARPPARPRPFHRLWEQLHCDPRRLPYAWFQEEGRWCCRLRSLTAEQRQSLECESVADCPDVELRILALPRMAPTLAEVVFPPTMTIVQAKQYIFRELQELPIQTHGPGFCWSEEPTRLVVRLADAPLAGTLPVRLEDGVCEMLGSVDGDSNGSGARAAAGHTCCVEFERAAGWDRARAEDWLQRHLGVRDLGRTARLDVPHRMPADLAAIVFELLGVDSRRPPRTAPSALEFVAVPPWEETRRQGDKETRRQGDKEIGRPENGRRSAAPRIGSKGGAGLEIDLGDPRQRERLPIELRPALPAQGLVNLAEAQAMVRHLEKLAGGADAATLTVAVLALYTAQVDLIRALVQRSSILSGSRLAVCVGDPAAFREREFPVVLFGLTRSHSHRAVSLGDGPGQLALALTRSRDKLILFGDPGTLGRRSQWEGCLDHLDDSAASWERDLVGRLLRYLHHDGTHPRAFHLREGKCP